MLEDAVVRKVLGTALATGGEWAEVYAEDRLSHNIRLEDQRVEELVTGRDRGAGVRVVKGTASAYAYTNRLDLDALLEAARVAAAAGALMLTGGFSSITYNDRAPRAGSAGSTLQP